MTKPVKKLTISGITIAIYINLMYLTQILSFGQVRIRVADCIYVLCYVYPFLIVPMGVANFLSCLFFGGVGIVDMIGWTIIGVFTSAAVCLVKKLQFSLWFTLIPVIIIPGLLASVWLTVLLHIPYIILVFVICAEQIIPAIIGIILMKKLKIRDS